MRAGCLVRNRQVRPLTVHNRAMRPITSSGSCTAKPPMDGRPSLSLPRGESRLGGWYPGVAGGGASPPAPPTKKNVRNAKEHPAEEGKNRVINTHRQPHQPTPIDL